MRSPLRKLLTALAGILLGVSIVVASLQEPPLEVARAYCASQGLPAENVAFSGRSTTGSLFGKTLMLELRVKGVMPPKTMVVELRQVAYFLPWRAVSLREKDE